MPTEEVNSMQNPRDIDIQASKNWLSGYRSISSVLVIHEMLWSWMTVVLVLAGKLGMELLSGEAEANNLKLFQSILWLRLKSLLGAATISVNNLWFIPSATKEAAFIDEALQNIEIIAH